MVTENVLITFRETGTRTIVRRIDDIAKAARAATRPIYQLEKALYVLGAAEMLAGLSTQLDMLTNMENRLKLVTTSSANLEQVQADLFATANRARTDVEFLGQIYTRTALSAQDLGISQQETMRFTESLAKASVLGGATAQEMNAALIQLSQGMASNRLSGDEMRSVLEQLPYVADIIADSIGVTRGELREMGSDGKITADVILQAFQDSAAAIDAAFAASQVTIEQSLSIAKNNWLSFLDRFDDATGLSNKMAHAIINLSNYIDEAAHIAMAFLILLAGRQIGVAIKLIWSLGGAMKALSAQYLAHYASQTSMNAQRVASIRLMAAEASTQHANTVAGLANQRMQLMQLQAHRAMLATQIASGRSRDLLTGRFISAAAASARLAAVDAQVAAAGRAIHMSNIALVQSTRARTAATAQLTTANNVLAASQARQAGTLALLASRFPLLGGLAIRAGTMGAGAIALMGGPITAVLAGIALLIAAFFRWGNAIKVTQDNVVGLKDYVIAAFQLMGQFFNTWVVQPIIRGFKMWIDAGKKAIEFMVDSFLMWFDAMVAIFEGVWIAFKTVMNFVIGIAVGTALGVIAAFAVLPAGLEAWAASAVNLVIHAFEWMAGKVVDILNAILTPVNAMAEMAGFDPIAEMAKPDFSEYELTAGAAGQTVAEAFSQGFSDGMNIDYMGEAASAAGNALLGIHQSIVDRARANITAAQAAANDPTGFGGNDPGTTGAGGGADDKDGGGSGGQKTKTFAELMAELQRETEIAKLSNAQRVIANGLIQMEEELKRSLTDAERNLAAAALRNLEIAKEAGALLDEIRGPEEDHQRRIAALNMLMQEGTLTAQEYAAALRSIAAAAPVDNSFLGGIRHGINQVIADADKFGEKISGWVTNSINGATDAIVHLANEWNNTAENGITKTELIKETIRGMLHSIFQELLKIATNRLITQLLMSLFPGGGFGMGMGAGIGMALPGAATGGSILPSGAGNTDTQIVSFRKRPDERVDVLTPEQQKRQRQNMEQAPSSGSKGDTPVQVNVAAVIKPSDIVSAFQGGEGKTVILDILQKNRSTVKSILG